MSVKLSKRLSSKKKSMYVSLLYSFIGDEELDLQSCEKQSTPFSLEVLYVWKKQLKTHCPDL